MRAYQRLHRVTGNREHTTGLLGRGFASAAEIASVPAAAFGRDHAELLGTEQAERVHRRAARIATQAAHAWATVSSNVVSPSARALRVSPAAKALEDAFKPLPSYEELFGSLDYVACPEANSMLGPAAYLVDLLRILERYVTEPNSATIPEGLAFEARRPDIANIPLTAEKTDGRVPYLRIVNERLVETACRQLKVKTEAEVLEQLAAAPYPPVLPVNLPLLEIRTLLGSAGVQLQQIYAAWGQPSLQVARESLQLTPTQLNLFTTSVATNERKLAGYYGIAAAELPELARVETFLSHSGLAAEQLSELIEEDLTEAELEEGIASTFFVNRGLAAQKLRLRLAESNGVMKIANLDDDALDRVNRFARFAAALGWSFVELDWALHAVANGQPVIEEAGEAGKTIGGLAQLGGLTETLDLDLLEASSLLTQLKTYGSAGEPTQFDQVFNDPGQLAGRRPYRPRGDAYNPGYASSLREWTIAGGGEADLATAGWLAGALGVSVEALRQLAEALFPQKTKLSLDVETLSALHRHALLSTRLQLPTDRYLALLAALGLDGAAALSATAATELVEAGRWLNASSFDAPTLTYVLAGGTPSPYVQVPYRAGEVESWLRSLWGLSANLPSAEAVEEQLLAQLAILFGGEPQRVGAAIALAAAGVTLPQPLKEWQEAFAAPASGSVSPHLQTVEELLELTARWLLLAGALDLPDALLEAVAAERTAFGFAAKPQPLQLSFARVRDLASFHGSETAFQDTGGGLIAFAKALAKAEPVAAQAKALAAVSGWSEAQVASLLGSRASGVTDAATALAALGECFGLAARLGADTGYAGALAELATLDESEWTEYEAIAAGVRDQVASLYDSATWEATSGRLDSQIDALKRDALLPLVGWQLSLEYDDITSDRGVYEFALIDVETGPAVEISYVVEATNAVQLYLQRCRLGLERGIERIEIPETWWQWLLSFRVWQANREVFLYPENYLLPSVRRNRTGLFRELESELQQDQVTEDRVAAAYEGYFAGFHELAKLKPVDCYRCEVNGPEGAVDTLFLFARTETAPPTFYYCAQENGGGWGEWTKVDVSIESESLTPLYAFNRLFVFWAELKKATDSAIVAESGPRSVSSAGYLQTIKYSFLDHSGSWVTPQTLVEERVVDYAPLEAKNAQPSNPLLSQLAIDAPSWQRVYAVKVGSDNLVEGKEAANGVEKISVFCGPFAGKLASSVSMKRCLSGKNEEEVEFLRALYESTIALDGLILTHREGSLPLAAPVNLDVNLQDDFVLAPDEFLVLSTAGNSSAAPLVRAEIDPVGDRLAIVPSETALRDEYLGGEEAVPPTPPIALTAKTLGEVGVNEPLAGQVLGALQAAGLLDTTFHVVPPFNSHTDIATALSKLQLTSAQLEGVLKKMLSALGTMVLLGAVSPLNSRTIPVKNQPGWFQLDNGDESFLLTLPPVPGANGGPSTPIFQPTETALTVRRPPLMAKSFEVASISAENAKTIFTTLSQKGLIDAEGNAAREAIEAEFASGKLASLLPSALSAAQRLVVVDVLLNAPYVFPGFFASPLVPETSTQTIYNELVACEVVDVNARLATVNVPGPKLEAAMERLQQLKTLNAAQVVDVYRSIVALTAPVEYAYRNHGASGFGSLWDYTFKAVRTSTGAADRLSRTLFAQGVPGLLSLASQRAPVVSTLPFERLLPSAHNLEGPEAHDGGQVDFAGVYGTYFWEVFFHVPMLVANGLGTNQQFEAAETWFRYVFDPTAAVEEVGAESFSAESEGLVNPADSATIFGELKQHTIGTPPEPILDAKGAVNLQFTAATPLGFLLGGRASAAAQSVVRNVLLNHRVATPADHYWRFWPFRNASLETLRETLADTNPAVLRYEDDPFDPFAIAALRIGAFEKAVVMQYVQNLISWGDSLFAQESFETTTAATMLYVHAFDLLGERPTESAPTVAPAPQTFAEIKRTYPTGIPTFLIEVENALRAPGPETPATVPKGTPFNALDTYFCVPENEQLLGCWDTLEDRLYKIRNSMNLEGEVRELPLFAPPLNPLELAKSAAQGGGFLPAEPGASAPIPAYRFESMLARARNVTAQVVEFGGKLLAALERQDAENLELLRSTQERQVLTMMTTLKEDAVGEAEATLASLRDALAGARNRVTHYEGLIKGKLSPAENANLDALATGLAFNILASGLRAGAAIAYTIPQAGSPFAMTYGGVQVGSALTAASAAAEIGSEAANFVAQRSLTMAGYHRREEDWTLAQQDAEHEVSNLEQQIVATEARLDGARRDLTLTRSEIAQNERVYEYLEDKFTSAELYQWLVSRISAVYFQAYRLAQELSLGAQECFRYELGLEESFVSFDYWDSLHKGLMAGENLSFSLAQMESQYVAKNTRRLEIERTVSLALWDPRALWQLRSGGECEFELSEQLFDYDYPGHYNRQIKSVTVSIPAVLGPYEDFKATLTQKWSAVATAASEPVVKYLLDPSNPKPEHGLRENAAPRQQIAISRGVDDAGVFQLDFRDERYLPFEGSGAVSRWQLQVPSQTNRFNLEAIADVIVTVRYTALAGGEPFEKEVRTLLNTYSLPSALYLSLAQAFAAQWNAFMAEHASTTAQPLSFEVAPGTLPRLAEATLTDVYVRLETAGVTVPDKVKFLKVAIESGAEEELEFAKGVGHLGGLKLAQKNFAGPWKLVFDLAAMRANTELAKLLDGEGKWLDPTKLLNVEVILGYEGSAF